jgi:hypothetical protein
LVDLVRSGGTPNRTRSTNVYDGSRAGGEHRPARCAVQAGDFGRPREIMRYMIEVVAHPDGN